MSLASRYNKESKATSKKTETCVSKLDARGLEKYLNSALEEAQTGVAKDGKNAAKECLARHHLSRSQLERQESLPHSSIDGIYRSLFVHSSCFAESFKDLLPTKTQRERLLPSIWIVFVQLCQASMKKTFSDEFAEIFMQFNEQTDRLQSLENTHHALLDEKEELKSTISTLEENLAEEKDERLRLKTENNNLKEKARTHTMSAEQLTTSYNMEVTERVTVEGSLRACKDKVQELAESEQHLKTVVEQLLDEKVNMEHRIESITDTAKYIISAMQLDDEDGQVPALETDLGKHSLFEAYTDSDLDAIACALKTVNALWAKYSAKVQQVEELEYALQKAKDEAFLQKTDTAELGVSST